MHFTLVSIQAFYSSRILPCSNLIELSVMIRHFHFLNCWSYSFLRKNFFCFWSWAERQLWLEHVTTKSKDTLLPLLILVWWLLLVSKCCLRHFSIMCYVLRVLTGQRGREGEGMRGEREEDRKRDVTSSLCQLHFPPFVSSVWSSREHLTDGLFQPKE